MNKNKLRNFSTNALFIKQFLHVLTKNKLSIYFVNSSSLVRYNKLFLDIENINNLNKIKELTERFFLGFRNFEKRSLQR